MQSRLIVKNFGPIEFVDLDLRNVNVFIGPQASGKSALAKLYTIFKAPRKFLKLGLRHFLYSKEEVNQILFKEVLEEYNIASFLKPNTEIEFDSELHKLVYINDVFSYTPKLLDKIEGIVKLKENGFEKNIHLIKKQIINLCDKYFQFESETEEILGIQLDIQEEIQDRQEFEKLNIDQFYQLILSIRKIDEYLSTNTALYIPSERNFINIIKNSSLNLLLNKVPIPKHILSFGAELEKIKINQIDLSFLHENLFYKNINGDDRIFTDKGNSIKLIEAAAGIQSVIPILLPVLSQDVMSYHRSFVIEEPELNLFPIAQYELIKRIESNRVDPFWEDDGAIHTYTTHSPYILSALNNLLYANKVKSTLRRNFINLEDETKHEINIEKQVNKIVIADIKPQYFTAYQINNGGAESIFDRETGLIIDNYIDEASDKIADDFDALMNLMK